MVWYHPRKPVVIISVFKRLTIIKAEYSTRQYFQYQGHSTKVNGQECLMSVCYTTLWGIELLYRFSNSWFSYRLITDRILFNVKVTISRSKVKDA